MSSNENNIRFKVDFELRQNTNINGIWIILTPEMKTISDLKKTLAATLNLGPLMDFEIFLNDYQLTDKTPIGVIRDNETIVVKKRAIDMSSDSPKVNLRIKTEAIDQNTTSSSPNIDSVSLLQPISLSIDWTDGTQTNTSLFDNNLSIDGSNSDDLEVDKMPQISEAVVKWNEKRKQQNVKLLQCIKDGKVETHLVGVYREVIPSERHRKFKNGSQSEKIQLKNVPCFGPIDDEEQQEEIYHYCSQLFESNFKSDMNPKTVAYIFQVWVPEAIVKAISRVRRIELKDSESILAKGVMMSITENEEFTKSFVIHKIKEIQKEAEKQMTSHTNTD